MIGLEARIAYRVHDDLRIDVRVDIDQECAVLFGPSGSGKSTILRLIAGLGRPDEGRIKLGDSVLFDSSSQASTPLRSRRIGLIFQDDLLFPHLSVEGNVRFGLHRLSKLEAARRVLEVAELCGITALLKRRPETLSGGERQRVGLARAIAPRPRLLLCDEPVSALDLEARHALIERLKAVRRAEAIPMLYVTHAVDEAIGLGDRLFLLEHGRIEAEGPPLEVLASRTSRGPARWPSLPNVFPALVEGHDDQGRSSRVRLVGGPILVVPRLETGVGAPQLVAIRSDDIVLARGPVGVLSARNLVEGRVERLVRHGDDVEVVVRTVEVTWTVGVVAEAVELLDLIPGREVRMIIKARSCQVLPDDPRDSFETRVIRP